MSIRACVKAGWSNSQCSVACYALNAWQCPAAAADDDDDDDDMSWSYVL